MICAAVEESSETHDITSSECPDSLEFSLTVVLCFARRCLVKGVRTAAEEAIEAHDIASGGFRQKEFLHSEMCT